MGHANWAWNIQTRMMRRKVHAWQPDARQTIEVDPLDDDELVASPRGKSTDGSWMDRLFTREDA